MGTHPPIQGVYKNWKGVIATRTVTPLEVWYGSTPWHKEAQWLLKAEDEDGKIKDFALVDFDFRSPQKDGRPQS